MSDLYTKISLDYWRLPGFIKFHKTSSYTVLMYLISYINRNPEIITGDGTVKKYFERFNFEGKLVARWSQRNLAKNLHMSLQTVSSCIKTLEDYGFLIRINKPKNNNTKEIITFYHLGNFTLSDKGKRKEELFFDILWRKSLNESKTVEEKFNLD